MDRQGFWDTIARARASVEDTYGDTEEFAEALTDVLAELEPAEITAFDREFQQLQAESYRIDLWAAAYLICGGASDDAFDYFRSWLVAQGRPAWDSTLTSPDSLANLLDPTADADFDGELVMYAAATAHERVTNSPLPPTATQAAVLAGEPFDFDDDAELQTRLPRLFAAIESLEADPEDEPDEEDDDEPDDEDDDEPDDEDQPTPYGDAWTPRR